MVRFCYSAALLVCVVGYCCLAEAGTGSGGSATFTSSSPESEVLLFAMSEGGDDPGYDLYKSGYRMILQEQWEEAFQQFRELEERHSESRYIDDALYWKAYSLARRDYVPEAIDAYRALLDRFPDSEYFDDAVADVTELETRTEIDALRAELEDRHHWMGAELDEKELQLARQYQRLTWRYRTHETERPRVDPETQVRIEALHALDPGADDEESIRIISEVVTTRTNPTALRVNAMHLLGSAGEETLPVLVSVAKNDTGEVRSIALAYIAEAPSEKSVDALIEVFHTIPESDDETAARVFYSIAEVGNDSAVDFLATVARTHGDLNLRRDAVYYLGAIGSDRARSALRVILQGK